MNETTETNPTELDGDSSRPKVIGYDLYANLRHQYDLRLEELGRLNEIIRRASVRFFEDGTSDGETAAAMLRILDEAKSPNDRPVEQGNVVLDNASQHA